MIATSGLAIFFDDYANTLLLGGTMRSTADRYGISREKLAYLVDSTAAPVAGLAVVSTWAAIEISYMGEGLKAGGIIEKSAAFRDVHPVDSLSLLSLARHRDGVSRCDDRTRLRRDARAESTAAAADERRPGTRPCGQAAKGQASRWLWIAAVLPVVLCLVAVAGVLVRDRDSMARSDPRGEGTIRLAGEITRQWGLLLALIVGGGVGCWSRSSVTLSLERLQFPVVTALGRSRCRPYDARDGDSLVRLGVVRDDRAGQTRYRRLSRAACFRIDSIHDCCRGLFLIAGAIAFSTGNELGHDGNPDAAIDFAALQLDPSADASGAIVSGHLWLGVGRCDLWRSLFSHFGYDGAVKPRERLRSRGPRPDANAVRSWLSP